MKALIDIINKDDKKMAVSDVNVDFEWLTDFSLQCDELFESVEVGWRYFNKAKKVDNRMLMSYIREVVIVEQNMPEALISRLDYFMSKMGSSWLSQCGIDYSGLRQRLSVANSDIDMIIVGIDTYMNKTFKANIGMES